MIIFRQIRNATVKLQYPGAAFMINSRLNTDAEQEMLSWRSMLCGIFYAVLCVFSIVTGLMYASGKKKLNPLELSEKFMSRYTDPDQLQRFTIKMGWVTFLVGVVQRITSFSIFHLHSAVFY